MSRSGVALGTTSTTSYTFAGLSCGQSYAVGVRAYDVSGNYSPWASFYVATSGCGDQSAPSAPTGLVQTTASTTGMSVAWKASSDNVGVAGYDVFRNGTKLGSTSNLSYALGSLSCGTSYSVGVDARDAAGNVSATTTATMKTSSCPSQPPSPPDPPRDNQPPTMPSNLALADATPSSMDLTWSPSTDNVGVTGYGVYLDGTLTQTVTGTTYDFVGQACGTSHHLSVEAYDRADNASQRAWVAASTSPCSSGSGAPSDTSPPTTPTNPVILSRTSTSVTVSWAASSDNVGCRGLRRLRRRSVRRQDERDHVHLHRARLQHEPDVQHRRVRRGGEHVPEGERHRLHVRLRRHPTAVAARRSSRRPIGRRPR